MTADQRASQEKTPDGHEPPWPNWWREKCAIIASGPSTKKSDVELLRGRVRVIAIKENYDLAPWADVVYGCDKTWWRQRRGLSEYSGLKLSWEASFPGVRKVSIPDPECERFLMDKVGVIGSGRNSGFQAINLAMQWGVSGILLLGFDMTDRGGVHWFGRVNAVGRSNPGEGNFKRWRAALCCEAPRLSALGIEVINASVNSALTCFPRMTVERALARWAV